ncbi:MAG TPA: hypothetical protein VF395_13955, partial [Polyangiaceae bacterium]
MRASDFVQAARLIDELPKERREEPEVRYVRARAAIALHDAPAARSLLAGLEHSLPVLGDAIVLA